MDRVAATFVVRRVRRPAWSSLECLCCCHCDRLSLEPYVPIAGAHNGDSLSGWTLDIV